MRIVYECSFPLVNRIRIDRDMIWMTKTIGTATIDAIIPILEHEFHCG